MMRSGKLYQLKKSERGTLENESGLWLGTPTASMRPRTKKFSAGRTPNPVEFVEMFPTPRANSGNGPCKHGEGGLDLQTAVLWPTPTVNGNYNRKGSGKKSGDGIATAVKNWPTPTAFDWNTPVKSRIEVGSKTYRGNLKEAVHQWPTPRAGGMCGGSGNWEQLKNKCKDIDESRKMGAGNGGQLNADWEERLMGYPDGWTDSELENVDAKNKYPEAWIDGSWDTIPRVAKPKKNTRKRIKGIGNSVVPQIPALIFGLIRGKLWD
jgi:hypothetical protein